MTTDMPEIIKVKENKQRKPWQKSSWKTLIPTMKQVKRERNNCALFFEIYRFLNTKENKNPSKKIFNYYI
jgi:hypothetical protein